MYIRLPFGVAPAGNMFQRKIDELFNDLPSVFGITDDILITGFDELGRDHDETEDKVLKICRDANLKLSKDNCHFRCTNIPFFRKIMSQGDRIPDPREQKAPMDMPAPRCKKDLQ